MPWTNRGKKMILDTYFRATAAPTTFYLALVTSAVTPTADINTLGELTQLGAVNGYTNGGLAVARNSTDFDTLTEDDTNDRGVIQIKDLSWTASGGNLGGASARYAVLTDDNGTVGSRQVLAWFDLGADRPVPSGQSLVLKDATIRGL